MAQRTVVVAGGGIGGLATAAALSRSGWQVRVFERAPRFQEVGAGISLWPNALRALDAIGVGERVRALGVVDMNGGIRNPAGRWLARTNTAEVARRYGPVVVLHRSDLLRILLEVVPPDALVPGAEVRSVEVAGASVRVGHAHGTISADLLVGADGIHSTVRRAIWPAAPAPRYAGYAAWRMITPRMADAPRLGGETWGRGERFGHATLPDGRVYCFATADLPPSAELGHSDITELRRRFGGWHRPIPELLDSVEGAAVLRHDIEELPDLDSFVRGPVALLGDAAHAMTPNLGQGACQALEDAATLAAVLKQAPEVTSALERYDRLRRRRAQSIARRSRRVGAVGQWASPLATALRDRALLMVPGSTLIRSLAPVLAWPGPDGIAGG